MKLKNTSKFSDKEVRKLIRIAKGSLSLKNVSIHVKNTNKGYGGTCYGNGINTAFQDYMGNCRYVRHNSPLIVVRITKNWDKLPYMMNKTYVGRYGKRHNVRKPKYIINNSHELLLSVLAHEFYHLKNWKTKNQGSEIKAEKHALKTLKKYRQLSPNKPAKDTKQTDKTMFNKAKINRLIWTRKRRIETLKGEIKQLKRLIKNKEGG